jgi:hypothetical protein
VNSDQTQRRGMFSDRPTWHLPLRMRGARLIMRKKYLLQSQRFINTMLVCAGDIVLFVSCALLVIVGRLHYHMRSFAPIYIQSRGLTYTCTVAAYRREERDAVIYRDFCLADPCAQRLIIYFLYSPPVTNGFLLRIVSSDQMNMRRAWERLTWWMSLRIYFSDFKGK